MTPAPEHSSQSSPWLSVWLKPRQTIERILAVNPKYRVLLLAALGGISSIVVQLILVEPRFLVFDWRLVAAGALAYAAFGVLDLYIRGLVFGGIGRMLRGRASQLELRALLAWSMVPYVLLLAIVLVAVASFGLLRDAGTGETRALAIVGLQILAPTLALWSFVMLLLMLGRVQGFGFWRTVANGLLGIVVSWVIVGVAVLSFRTFAFQPFSTPSSSMHPTLLVGDHLFASKYAYGYSRYSLPFSPPLISGRILGGQPQYGDVVIFRLPKDTRVDYIKRVVGLPGDRVQMVGGLLHINGEPVKRERLEDFNTEQDGKPQRIRRWRETLPNGASHETLDAVDRSFYDDTPLFNVPPGHYFVVGDNRDNSVDSRALAQVGYIPYENLVGRAAIIFYSVQADSSSARPQPLRPERFGLTVR